MSINLYKVRVARFAIARLEIECGSDVTVGSNPTLSVFDKQQKNTPAGVLLPTK